MFIFHLWCFRKTCFYQELQLLMLITAILMLHFCLLKNRSTSKISVYYADIDVFTCREVMDPLCPCSTATGAQVRRHQTRMVLSQLPAAINVFS